MKKSLGLPGAIVLSLMTAITVQAASTPMMINYQGLATDTAGVPVADGPHVFQFVIYTHPTAGSTVLVEDVTLTTAGGLFNHSLGSITPIPDAAFVENDSLFLQVSIDGETQLPRTPIASVGYALRVNTVDSAKGGTIQGSLKVRDVVFDDIHFKVDRDPIMPASGNLRVYSNTGSSNYISLDGSATFLPEPRIVISGTDRSIHLNTSESGSASVQLPADAIDAAEVLDEPGVGSYLNNGLNELESSVEYLGGRTMFAPTDGFVFVSASAGVIINHSNGTISECFLGLSDNLSNFPAFGKQRVGVPAAAGAGYYNVPFSAHMIFPVQAGSQAYYLMGNKWSGGGQIWVQYVSLTEIFIPTAYTTVTDPLAEAATESSAHVPFDPGVERAEALAFNQNRIAAELARITAEFEALKKQLQDESVTEVDSQ